MYTEEFLCTQRIFLLPTSLNSWPFILFQESGAGIFPMYADDTKSSCVSLFALGGLVCCWLGNSAVHAAVALGDGALQASYSEGGQPNNARWPWCSRSGPLQWRAHPEGSLSGATFRRKVQGQTASFFSLGRGRWYAQVGYSSPC